MQWWCDEALEVEQEPPLSTWGLPSAKFYLLYNMYACIVCFMCMRIASGSACHVKFSQQLVLAYPFPLFVIVEKLETLSGGLVWSWWTGTCIPPVAYAGWFQISILGWIEERVQHEHVFLEGVMVLAFEWCDWSVGLRVSRGANNGVDDRICYECDADVLDCLKFKRTEI